MAIAVAASVTVSIADDTIGMARRTRRQLRAHVDVLGNDVAFSGTAERRRTSGFAKMTVRQHLGILADSSRVEA
jgi:hypothetical protein